MRRLEPVALVVAFLSLCGGCATATRTTAETGSTPVSTLAEDTEPRHRDTLYTAMLPRDAAVAAAQALNEKFGLQVGSGNSFGSFNESVIGGDHFSAAAAARTSAGGTMQMDFEWINDGKTKVGLSSDLPDAQYEAVMSLIRSTIGATDK